MERIINPNPADWDAILARPMVTYEDIEETVLQVFREVRAKGDVAIAKYTALFDGVELDSQVVSTAEMLEAADAISDELKQAIELAKANITAFHAAQQTEAVAIETTAGVTCWQEKRPIQKVGLYIPGGTAPLFSTVLMLAIPARIAGCEEVILCTPPDRSGKVHPAILFAAATCGVSKIVKVGGIQAIAGLSFGTETIPAVSKIFGPGNQYVTVAKQVATTFGLAIDMPAGPSELLVMADDTANPAYVAADLLSQAEHGPDSQVILVSTSRSLIDAVVDEIEAQVKALPRRKIAEAAMKHSRMILVSDNATALDLINAYAPEHFIVCTADDDYFTAGIRNAGSVFIGPYTPESAGDYASGTNHTLPTNGFARAYSGINLDSFQKSISFQQISDEGLKAIGNAIEVMADAEGLQAHKAAVTIRLNDLK